MSRIKYSYIAILMLTMVFPLVSHFKNARKYMQLKGDVRYQERPTFTIDGWLSGEYQIAQQKYMEEHVGLRNLFIRIHNQIQFSCFGEPSARGVIIGKEDYLFEENYINEYYGINYLGDELIDVQVEKIAKIQSKLAEQNKLILFVIGPNKAAFYSDKIPDSYLPKRKANTNHKRYVAQFEKHRINCIDFSSWMNQQRDKSPYPLYPRTGIHWSNYAQALFLDSLSSYLNEKNFPVSGLSFPKINVSSDLQFYDDDIEQGMNLLFALNKTPHAYPELLFDKKSRKSNAILIGDSYLWNMFERGFFNELFLNYRYFYYNEDVYSSFPSTIKKTIELDMTKEVENTDLILVLCTEANLHRQFFFIVEDLYNTVCLGKETGNYQKRLKETMEKIRNTKEWAENLRKKASAQGKSFEEVLKEDAAYVLSTERRK